MGGILLGSSEEPFDERTLGGCLTDSQHWEGLFSGSDAQLSSAAGFQIPGDSQPGEIPVLGGVSQRQAIRTGAQNARTKPRCEN